MTEYRVYAQTIDAFKFIGNLGYYTAMHIEDIVIPANTSTDPVEDTCKGTIDHLYFLARKEAKLIQDREYQLTKKDEEYLAKTLYNEVHCKGEIGVGANGIGAIFAFKIKALKAS